MNNLNYCEVVCNFLNNTKGCIEDNEIKVLLEVLFKYDIEENELKDYLSADLKDKINEDIECDKSNDLYEDLYTLYKNLEPCNNTKFRVKIHNDSGVLLFDELVEKENEKDALNEVIAVLGDLILYDKDTITIEKVDKEI